MFTPAVPATASEDSAGIATGREVVAVVNGEEIFLDELGEAVAARHQNLDEDTPTAWVGYTGILDRLISTKLIIQEARDVGLEERPGIRRKIQRFRDQMLVKLIKEEQLLKLKPDEDDIERIFRDEVRNWKYRAIVFEDLEQARAFHSEIEDGEEFETAGDRYIQEGKAAWDGGEREAREADINPEIASAFTGKEVNSVTPVIKAVNRFFIFKLTGASYPENPAARERATRRALNLKREEVLKEYTDRLIEKYVSIDQEVLSTVGTGDFTDMEKDSRVLAEIADEDPVVVPDLIDHLKGKFYHGEKTSEYTKALGSGPEAILREILDQRLLLKEARRTGIDRTDRYRRLVVDFENSLVFDMYIKEFLVPQARVPEEEIRASYEERAEEFLMPRTVEVDSLTFTDGDNARKALKSLKRGADLKWLSENVQGLNENGVSREELFLDTLPDDLQTLFADAGTGDTGLYEAGDEIFKVFIVRNVPPRKREPLDKVRPKITRELFGKRMNQVIEDLTAELRELSEITVYEDKLGRGPLRQGREEQ